MAESWGDWTVEKLEAFEKYIHGFALACTKARRTLYLDLFAGSAENTSRSSGEPIAGSPIIAMECSPPFTKSVFCELNERKADSLEATLSQRFPDRDFDVLQGDCNRVLPEYLARLANADSGWRLAPSFALIDQYSAEVEWSTLEFLAEFRQPVRGKARKTELWLYFGQSLIPRGSHGTREVVASESYKQRVTAMFGTEEWLKLRSLRLSGQITGREYTAELVNFMRWRLENFLGYHRTIPLPVLNSKGTGLYTMLFATDEPVGHRIMASVSENAARSIDEMVRIATAESRDRREAEAGVQGLFDTKDVYERNEMATSSAQSYEQLMLGGASRPAWL